MLLFIIRHRTQEIIDFYRNFTVEVTGVGDVCSFAQMDIRKHAHPDWTTAVVNDSIYEEGELIGPHIQAEGGKTEMSLIHFKVAYHF